jgi:succinate dehydrogenase/fumarate reductase flavoprotein subunit
VIYTRVQENKNIILMLETPATGLILSGGKVTGVTAVSSETGEKYNITAKGRVIIATGGFAEDTEMMAKYTDVKPAIIAPLNKTGDGIKWLMALGAPVEDMADLNLLVGRCLNQEIL